MGRCRPSGMSGGLTPSSVTERSPPPDRAIKRRFKLSLAPISLKSVMGSNTSGGCYPMSHVFVSYGRSTEAQAHAIADALRSCGFEVWRDNEIPANRAYSEVIEERLKSAKAVVVVWSAE